MTTPGPRGMSRRRLANHTEQETLELEARQGIYVNHLPSARATAEVLDAVTGTVLTPEQEMRGWTAQQPFVHVDCPVMHICVMCALVIDPDYLRDHERDCAVTKELAA